MTHSMKLGLPALAVLGALITTTPASAGWNSVFLTSCNDCVPRRVFSPPAPAPACNTCPETKRDVQYEQRCYYEPVKVLKPEKYIEEVAVKVKSYYYEPVTSYTYRSYYDPCNPCEKLQVAVPKTSYVRKEQCDTVMKAVERTRMVPVEMSRKICETRPIYTTYGPTTRTYGSLEPVVPGGSAPRIEESRPLSPGSSSTIPSPGLPVTPTELGSPKNMPGPSTMNQPKINAYSTSRTSMKTMIRGEVVTPDQQTPRSGAKIVFVNVANLQLREYVTADDFGGFDLKLTPGEWHMYVGSGTGEASYFKKIIVKEGESRNFTVVSR